MVIDVSTLGFPPMRADMLATQIPTKTFHRYAHVEPFSTLYVFRSGRFDDRAVGGTLCFYAYDYKLEALWTRRDSYRDLFIAQGWGGLVAPDFSLWSDAPIAEQIYNVYKSRVLARMWQDAGVPVAPNLSWSDSRSFDFCFEGLPVNPPVAYCQCRTIRKDERPAFLTGLREALRRVKPQSLILYGQADWLDDADLPEDVWISRLPAVIDELRRGGFGSGTDSNVGREVVTNSVTNSATSL